MSTLFSKPFALSIGPQACGADILYDYFRGQRAVVLPRVREVFFFDRHIQRGAEFYKNHFEDRADAKLFMEVTTTAFDHPQAAAHVHETLGGDAKLFCPLRDPVQRAWAVYQEYLRYGIVKGSLQDACEQAPQILFASRYSDHLPSWLALFPDIYFLRFEDLQAQPEESLAGLCDFLDLPFDERRAKRAAQKQWVVRLKNSLKPPVKMTPAQRAWLDEQLTGEAQRVEDLIGNPLFSK